MDNSGSRKLDSAKPYIINKNGTNLALSNRGVKFDRQLTGNADMA